MIYKVYSLYDTAGEYYMLPSFERTDDSCIRNLVGTVLQNKDSLIYFKPDDFMLYHIGEFDNEKGEFNGCLPRLVGRVGSLVKGSEATADE